MQFSQISTIFLAAMATAMPAPVVSSGDELVSRTDQPKPSGPKNSNNNNKSPNTCNNTSTQVCCNGVLTCIVQALGANCGGSVHCCGTETSSGNFINISALNCIQL